MVRIRDGAARVPVESAVALAPSIDGIVGRPGWIAVRMRVLSVARGDTPSPAYVGYDERRDLRPSVRMSKAIAPWTRLRLR